MWTPGHHVVLRQIWRTRIWAATPVTVVSDDPHLIALHTTVGTPRKKSARPTTWGGEGWASEESSPVLLPYNNVNYPGAHVSGRSTGTVARARRAVLRTMGPH